MTLKAPFPWFGGKSTVADEIWQRFGRVDNYVEPFFGSGAVLLARPNPRGVETINDADGFVANFWRATQAAPDEVAKWANWPVNEADKEARHYWLVTEGRERLARVLGNPDGYDAKVAGWWVWGICIWIGGGFCSGDGPWQWTDDGWQKRNAGQGINRQMPHLSAGQGINRQMPHLSAGRGINRQMPHLSAGRGAFIRQWFTALSERLRGVRVACGDWSRVTGDSVTWRHGKTAVFLDPPYAMEGRTEVYAMDCGNVSADARAWAIEAGKRQDMLICLAGYDGEHDMPDGWTIHRWKANGGYGSQGDGQGRTNASRETLWFSPACNASRQGGFDL
jgi:DNA adenine methylase